MLSVPPKSKAGFVVIGVLAGLILTIAHLPHHAAGPGPGVGARPFPFLPDLTTLRLPGCTTPLVELGGPYGGSTEGEDHLDEGRQHPELIKKEDEGWLQGEVGYALFGQSERANVGAEQEWTSSPHCLSSLPCRPPEAG